MWEGFKLDPSKQAREFSQVSGFNVRGFFFKRKEKLISSLNKNIFKAQLRHFAVFQMFTGLLV